MPLLEAAKPSLIDINFGLMFWTIVTFLIVLYVLKRFAFGPIQAMLDERRTAIASDIDAAETGARGGPDGAGRVPRRAGRVAQGGDADRRGRPPHLRGAAAGGARRAGGREDPPGRARARRDRVRAAPVAAGDQGAAGRPDGRGHREGGAQAAGRGRAEAADRRGPGRRRPVGVLDRAGGGRWLSGSRQEHGSTRRRCTRPRSTPARSTRSTATWPRSPSCWTAAVELRRTMLNPQLPHEAKKRVIEALMADADPLARNALMVLVDNGRLAFLHDIQVAFHEMSAVEERILDVEVTSAVPLDQAEVDSIQERISSATGLTARLSRVGRSLHHRRPRAAGPRRPARCLRQARAGRSAPRPDHHTTAHRERSVSLRPDEIAAILKTEIERYEVDVDVEEVGTVIQIGDGIARIYGLERCVALEKLQLDHGVTGLALNLEEDNVAAVLFGEWEKISEGSTVRRTGEVMSVPGRRGADRPRGRPAGQPARRRRPDRDHRDPPAGVQGPRRRPAPAGEGAAADRHQGDRLDDPDRPRPARADHRRPRHRQDRDRRRHDHQPEGPGRDLRLRRHRPEGVDRAPGGGDAPPGGRDGVHDHRLGAGRRGRADQVHGAVRRRRDGRALPLQRPATRSASTTT